ncbi:protein translocase subunit [Tasmannia lanceolata]|uniref:protein translocase subunit n=1 Tax=Tasmannia lanceolata TaxID=3420 RepID=UPI004062D228
MSLGALRNTVRPFAQKILLPHFIVSGICTSPATSPLLRSLGILGSFLGNKFSPLGSVRWEEIHSLTDTRFPKRRPGIKPRRKRASLKPPGPYAWVQYVPGEPIPSSRPNEGSVKGRNRIKRIKQRKAFIKSEAKKRKAQMSEAKKKKLMKRIERKMAAVARERAWAERLVELQKLELEKKNSVA